MRRVVIESRYAGDVDTNVAFARACMLDSLRRGEAPFLSHLLYTQVWDDSNAAERAAGIQAGLAWHAGADAVIVYLDLGISDGMQLGIDNARRLGTPVEERWLNP